MNTSFSEILNSSKSRAEMAKIVADIIRQEKGYSWVGVYDVNETDIRIISCAGRSEPLIPSFPKDKGLNGRAVSQGKAVVVNDIDKDEDYLLTFTNTKSEVVVPVFGKDGTAIVGTIDVEDESVNAFGDEDVKYLEKCAKDIAQLWQVAE